MELQYETYPLPAGNKAVGFTVQKMLELVRAGIKSPAVRAKAVQIVKASGARPYDQRAEVSAVFSFVKHTFRFIKDPTLVELLHTPEKLLEIRSGDCDDFSVITCALLGSIGYETRLAVTGPAKGIWSHVYPEVWLGGRWVPLDATAERTQILAAKKAGNYKTFSLKGGSMLGQPLPAVQVQKTVVLDGANFHRQLVQGVIDYLNAELDSGRMKPQEIARYLSAVDQEGRLTPQMKAAVKQAVGLVGLYRFGYSSQRMAELSRLAGPDLGGFLGGIVRAVTGVVKGAVGVVKTAIGIPPGETVKVKVELPPTTSPQPVSVMPGVTAEVDASKVAQEQALLYGKSWLEENWKWVAGGVVGFGLLWWQPWRKRRAA